MFERLPRTVPDGDAALAAVWQLVAEEKERKDARAQRRKEVLTSVPADIRAAIEQGDVKALDAALKKLPTEQAKAIVQQLQEAGVIGQRAAPDMGQVLKKFAPLLQAIAAAATDQSLRPKIEAVLPKLEQQGWRLTDPVRRLWSGERDPEALAAGLDANSAQLVRRILELLGT